MFAVAMLGLGDAACLIKISSICTNSTSRCVCKTSFIASIMSCVVIISDCKTSLSGTATWPVPAHTALH